MKIELIHSLRLRSATTSLKRLIQMESLYEKIKNIIRDKNPKYRVQDITDHLFFYVVTSPSIINHQTASKYLKKLEEDGIVGSRWVGKQHLFICTDLFRLII